MSRPLRRVRLAWHNLVHQKRKLAGSVAGIAFAAVLMFVQTGFLYALLDNTVELFHRMDADLFLVSDEINNFSMGAKKIDRDLLSHALGHEGVAAALPFYIERQRSSWKRVLGSSNEPIRILAFDPDQSVFVDRMIDEQRPLLKGRHGLLFDQKSKSIYGKVDVGSLTELNDREIRVVGLFDLGTDFANDGNILMGTPMYARLFGGDALDRIDLGLIKLTAGAEVGQVVRSLREVMPAGVTVFSKDELMAREKSFWSRRTPVGVVFGIGTALGFVVGVIICYQILYSDVSDNLAEFATLKAMGYTGRFLIQVVLAEAFWLALLGFIPAFLITWQFYQSLTSLTGLLMRITFERSLLIFTLTVVMCMASGCLAVRKVLAADPAELFR